MMMGSLTDTTVIHRLEKLDRTEIDASIHPCCWLLAIPTHCGLGPYRTIIKLEQEEIIRHDVSLCGSSTSHRPYSAIGTVQQSNCLCLTCIDSNLGPLISGWGCDEEWTQSTAQELKQRAALFSDWNRILMTNDIAARTELLMAKMEAIERHLEMHPQAMIMTER